MGVAAVAVGKRFDGNTVAAEAIAARRANSRREIAAVFF
jgi:hypothetical protein